MIPIGKDPLSRKLDGPWNGILDHMQRVFAERTDGDRCRHCGTMDDRIHGLECPVMTVFHVLQLALWTVHLEELLSEFLGNAKSGGHDSKLHVTAERDRIRKWRIEFTAQIDRG